MSIRIFGIQRSGTNYTESLIDRLTPLAVTAGNPDTNYWKHSYSPESEFLFRHDIHIVIVKHPFKWLESLHRYNADLALRSGEYEENFFNNEAVRKASKHIIYDKRNQPTAIEGAANLYNTFYNRWFEFSTQNNAIPTYLIRYEDIIRNPTKFLRSLQRRIGIRFPIKAGALKEIDQSSNFPKSRIRDYLDMHHFSILDDDTLEYARQLFDEQLIYERLEYPRASSFN